MKTRPNLRRQLSDSPSWAFWRDNPTGPGRQGFLCTLIACTNPGCDCTEITLTGILVDDRLRGARFENGAFRLEWQAGRGDITTDLDEASREVVLDLDTRAVRPLGDDDADADLLTWMKSEVDDELIDAARHLHNEARRTKPAAPDPWQDWQPGDLVSFRDAFPGSVLAELEYGGRKWLLDDLHCVERKCPCHDVRILCFSLPRDNQARPAFGGTFVVTLPDLDPREVECEEGAVLTPGQLGELWQEVRRPKASLADDLARRRLRMKELRPPSRGTVTAKASKVGRNDPCPCGSGRMWRKCCGRIATSTKSTT